MGIDPQTFAKKLENFLILQYFGPEVTSDSTNADKENDKDKNNNKDFDAKKKNTKRDQKHNIIFNQDCLPPREEGVRHVRKILQDGTRMYLEYSKRRDLFEKQWSQRMRPNVSAPSISTKK